MGTTTGNVEIDAIFRSKAEWDAWTAVNSHVFDQSMVELIVKNCLENGISSHFLGYTPSKDVVARSKNYRESLLAFGFNPRQRAILDLIHADHSGPQFHRLRIHLHEAITKFALAIKGRFPYVLASEYLPDAESQRRSFPIPHVDICDSGLPGQCFDMIVSQEVLEHVPSMDAAFRDMARILKPGGKLLATVPFLRNAAQSLRKAALKQDGTIEYITEPEYHGNPVDSAGGSLVFEIPGWDVLDRMRNAGFGDAMIRAVGSKHRGIIGQNMTLILVLVGIR